MMYTHAESRVEIDDIIDENVCKTMGVGNISGALTFEMRETLFWKRLSETLKECREHGVRVELTVKLQDGRGGQIAPLSGYIGTVTDNTFTLHKNRPY